MRALVLVTGPVASGKSTVAEPLAARLGLPLVTKDVVKEALFDALGTGDQAWSKQLSEAAYAVVFALVPGFPAAVLESNFRAEHGPRLLQLCPRPVELYCHCPREELARRFTSRRRHPGHLDEEADLGTLLGDPGPLALGGPLRKVDTTRPVDVDALVAWVTTAGSLAPPARP